VMPAVSLSQSAFSPSSMVSCVDSHYNVDLEDCKLASSGHGLPSSAGEYSLLWHRFSLGLSLDFQ
jgi:hypothetical protein